MVAGSLKADAPPLACDPTQLQAMKSAIGGRPVLLAAQTHPGEDETILPAHDLLRGDFPDLLTVIVPRHVERGRDIAMLCGSRQVARRAAGEAVTSGTAIYIADTMNELGLFYRLAPFCFLGGSLVPMGGHNPLEPASLHCAVLAGPSRANSALAFEAVLGAQGFGVVHNAGDIARAAKRLIADPRSARAAGQRRPRAPQRFRVRWKKPSPLSIRFSVKMRAPEFWKRDGAASALLAPFGALYGLSVAWKARHAKPYRAEARVICVGNLTAGGSGKTPVALAIGARLKARGENVFFLTRGYGGSEAGPFEVTAKRPCEGGR